MTIDYCEGLLAPKEAAEALRISVATISRCVKMGAPVHRWGSTGHRYRIELREFVNWMESRDQHKPVTAEVPREMTYEEKCAVYRERRRKALEDARMGQRIS